MEKHTTVLLTEAVDTLAITKNSVVVDATLGSGGHAGRIVGMLGAGGTYIGIDIDPEAVERARNVLMGEPTIVLACGNFRDINSILNNNGIGTVNAILADLGWRMEQFTGNGKGFSFRIDEPLIMTYGDFHRYPFTARDIVNEWDAEHIEDVLVGSGEERYARRISTAIVKERAVHPIETTFDLVTLIERVVPNHYRYGKIHPATRTFQALRMTVNDELGTLAAFMDNAVACLSDGGRLAIITFHSIEDRMVKHTFRTYVCEGLGELITKKPIIPTREEIIHNPRARSAKLRVFKKHETTVHNTL